MSPAILTINTLSAFLHRDIARACALMRSEQESADLAGHDVGAGHEDQAMRLISRKRPPKIE